MLFVDSMSIIKLLVFGDLPLIILYPLIVLDGYTYSGTCASGVFARTLRTGRINVRFNEVYELVCAIIAREVEVHELSHRLRPSGRFDLVAC